MSGKSKRSYILAIIVLFLMKLPLIQNSTGDFDYLTRILKCNIIYEGISTSVLFFLIHIMVVTVKRKRKKVYQGKVAFQGRSYKDYSAYALQLKLTNAYWDPFYQSGDPEYCWDYIENLVREYWMKAVLPTHSESESHVRHG